MYLQVLKQEKKFGFRFRRLNDTEKGITNASSEKKLTTKLCLVYFHFKQWRNSYACWINNKKVNKKQK